MGSDRIGPQGLVKPQHHRCMDVDIHGPVLRSRGIQRRRAGNQQGAGTGSSARAILLRSSTSTIAPTPLRIGGAEDGARIPGTACTPEQPKG